MESNFEEYFWHFDMLHDTERNVKYAEAIQKTIGRVKRKKLLTESRHPTDINSDANSTPIVALDIGTGSGLLAMMAAKVNNNTYSKGFKSFDTECISGRSNPHNRMRNSIRLS
jgi:predicted RNA methylase